VLVGSTTFYNTMLLHFFKIKCYFIWIIFLLPLNNLQLNKKIIRAGKTAQTSKLSPQGTRKIYLTKSNECAANQPFQSFHPIKILPPVVISGFAANTTF
jgi:hypothetical protein